VQAFHAAHASMALYHKHNMWFAECLTMYQRDRSDAAQGRKGQRWFMVWQGSSRVYAPHDTHCAQESQQATPL
jgi:hypothetical protein